MSIVEGGSLLIVSAKDRAANSVELFFLKPY